MVGRRGQRLPLLPSQVDDVIHQREPNHRIGGEKKVSGAEGKREREGKGWTGMICPETCILLTAMLVPAPLLDTTRLKLGIV